MSSGVSDGRPLAWAEQAYALVQARPLQARALAERALAAASAQGDAEAQLTAMYALAWAQNVLGDAKTARKTMRAGIRLGTRYGDGRRVALLRRLLAFSLAFAGESRAAQREIDAALAVLSARDWAQSQVHRLEIHRLAHPADPAVHRRVCADAARALRLLQRDGDEFWEAILLYNRACLYLDRGELDAAEADARRAHTLYSRVGGEGAAVDALEVLGEVALLRGDLLTCLATLEDVEASLPPGHINYSLDESRSRALAQARLLPEARAAAEKYVDLCVRTGRRDIVARTMLDLAGIAMLTRDAAEARAFATKAARSFAARRKPVNAALARAAFLRAQLLDGSVRRSSVRSGIDAAAVLETAGWRRDALRTHLLVARLALAVGAAATAREQLELARPLRTRGTVADRIELCHVRALLRLSEGDPAGAERLLVAGLRLLEEYQAALGAVELRATASGTGIELSQQGLRIAVESGDAAKILAWAERLRGNALRLPLVHPPADPALGSLQAELRRVAARIRHAEERGKPAYGAAARQAELEAAIRTRSRLVQGDHAAPAELTDVRAAASALGERALVEYVELDGVLSAVTLVGGELTLHELGSADVRTELEWLRFGLTRVARAGAPAARAAALDTAAAAAAELAASLIAPLLPVLGDAPLVLVPTGALHALPWAALPSLRGRPFVVSPSLSVWLALARRPRSRARKTALVGGPRLRHSATEVRDLAALLPGSTVLHGQEATAAATLAALDGAALAHIACHGRFRADSPLFSSLELADGPLNVYELQRLRRAPDVVVLSACDLASSGVHPGDEVLGLAAALLGMGTRTIVASVVPVPDAAAKRLMLAFHRNLLAGEAPAMALAHAQAKTPTPGFVCLGTG